MNTHRNTTGMNSTTLLAAHRNAANEALRRIEGDESEGVVFFDEIADEGGRKLNLPAGWSEADAREMADEAVAENNALRGYSRDERAIIKAGRLHGEDDVHVFRSRRVH